MPIILGIDPGSRITGFGVIDSDGNRHRYIASGCIKMAELPLPERLHRIYAGIAEIVATYHPEQSAIEQVFLSNNADSALKLGQARGAALAALVAGCATTPTGRSQLILVDDSAMDRMGASAFDQIKSSGRLARDPAATRYVRCVADALVRVGGFGAQQDAGRIDAAAG